MITKLEDATDFTWGLLAFVVGTCVIANHFMSLHPAIEMAVIWLMNIYVLYLLTIGMAALHFSAMIVMAEAPTKDKFFRDYLTTNFWETNSNSIGKDYKFFYLRSLFVLIPLAVTGKFGLLFLMALSTAFLHTSIVRVASRLLQISNKMKEKHGLL